MQSLFLINNRKDLWIEFNLQFFITSFIAVNYKSFDSSHNVMSTLRSLNCVV